MLGIADKLRCQKRTGNSRHLCVWHQQEFVAKLGLQPEERVLDVGCGIGGGDFLMASRHGAYVHGIDLSVNMVLIGLERAQQQNQTQVRFRVSGFLGQVRPSCCRLYKGGCCCQSRHTMQCDFQQQESKAKQGGIENQTSKLLECRCPSRLRTARQQSSSQSRTTSSTAATRCCTSTRSPPCSSGAPPAGPVHGRRIIREWSGRWTCAGHSIAYVLFATLSRVSKLFLKNWVGCRFKEMLRPGGRLLISDYCRKAGAVSAGFEKYIKQRGYDLHRHVLALCLQ